MVGTGFLVLLAFPRGKFLKAQKTPNPASDRNSSGSQRKKRAASIERIKAGCSVLRSKNGCGSWLPHEPKCFSVASPIPKERSEARLKLRHFRVLRAGTRWGGQTSDQPAAREHLRHNNYQEAASKTDSRATPPHRQNLLSVALLGNGLHVQTRDCKD